MKDRVFIEGLTVLTTIGVYDWEKTIKQKLILDLEMEWNNQKAGLSDDVSFCLDYAKVTQHLENHIKNNQFGLIERVAEEVANILIQEFSVPWVKVKVSKPTAIPSAKNVGVVIERRK